MKTAKFVIFRKAKIMKKQTYVSDLAVHKDTVYAAIYNGKDCS